MGELNERLIDSMKTELAVSRKEVNELKIKINAYQQENDELKDLIVRMAKRFCAE
jgi:N-methylhydantoinase B/oxoprolinase/acetone carboxylase alpha subunit